MGPALAQDNPALCVPPSSLPSTPSSPVGDIMQTPQFQLRRLKEQLVFERENREELEVEMAANHKLVMEKGESLAGCSGVQVSVGHRSPLVSLTFLF